MQTFRGSMLARLLACLLARLLVVCELRTVGTVRITKNSVGTKGLPTELHLDSGKDYVLYILFWDHTVHLRFWWASFSKLMYLLSLLPCLLKYRLCGLEWEEVELNTRLVNKRPKCAHVWDFIANSYCFLQHVKISTIFLIMNLVNGSHPRYFTDKEEVVVEIQWKGSRVHVEI